MSDMMLLKLLGASCVLVLIPWIAFAVTAMLREGWLVIYGIVFLFILSLLPLLVILALALVIYKMTAKLNASVSRIFLFAAIVINVIYTALAFKGFDFS